MIYIKENPVGVDVVINDIQRKVNEALGWTSYNAYHRIYKNEKENGGTIPEFYNGEGNTGDYEEVLLNDNLHASSFFYVADNVPMTGNGRIANTVVSLVMQVDLNKITGENKRTDEEVHRDVLNAINGSIYGKANALITKLSSVYSEFDTTNLSWDDMQPYHVFRVDIDVSYQYDCCDNCKYQRPIVGNDYILI